MTATAERAPRDRPSLRQASSAALVGLAVGAIVAWTSAPVAASSVTPVVTGAAAADPFRQSLRAGPAWIVSPRAARPGEVVHVRLIFKPPINDSTGLPETPPVLFAFAKDLRHPVRGRLYLAEGTFGVDLVVPPGTDWGRYPIVWAEAQVGNFIAAIPADSLFVITTLNPPIPFIASRSAQPPLWNR